MSRLNVSRIILAPMEGLADDVLRDVLTRAQDHTGAAPYDWCVTEFIRVTTTVLPHSNFRRVCPELNNASRTRAGTPVRVQLLGSSPTMLAANAEQLAQLKPAGIDLNFGCPTPLVNRNRGGAALLDEPELLHSIASAVRRAVPREIPVTAKMRLGIEDTGRALECAQALANGGAEELVVHARTKKDGYRPPARWDWVARIREAVGIPVIANGEVWSVADYHAIRDITGCADVMLGRGAIADPMLALRIRRGETDHPTAEDWQAVLQLIGCFWLQAQAKVLPHQSPGRLKQWLGLMCRRYPQAETLYAKLRELRTADAISRILAPETTQ
jgi:tRNA-dihydrouridine synthase C